MICETCGVRENSPTFNGRKGVIAVLSNFNDLMLCPTCINKARKTEKKRGDSTQTNLF